MHQHRLTWQEREIAWTKTGSGPPVVLVHGTPFSARVWSTYAKELSSRYTVYTWDMPGYGESSKHPHHPVNFDVHAKGRSRLW